MHNVGRSLSLVCTFLVFLGFGLAFVYSASAAEPAAGPPLVTLTVHKVPVGQAIKQIAELIGYEIQLHGIDQGEKVSGVFSNQDVGSVFNQLLGGYNIVTMIDMERHQVEVRSLGRKFTPSSRPDGLGGAVTQTKDTEETGGRIVSIERGEIISPSDKDSTEKKSDPFTGQSEEKIAALHAEQQKEMERILNNPNHVDVLTGMTNSEINELHSRQKAEIQQVNGQEQ